MTLASAPGLAGLPAERSRHPLHNDAQTWPEVNCYVDLWVELLHDLGFDPLRGCGFALESDLDGRQWSFHKYGLEDLCRIYGLRVAEVNVWQGVERHVRDALADGRLLTVEVDAFHLPDTVGVSYQRQHVKTTIGVYAWDPSAGALGYVHGRGRYVVEGPDALRLLDFGPLPPYVESIVRGPVTEAESVAATLELARTHVARQAAGNPVPRLAERLHADLDWLIEATAADEQVFHDYAFGTVRQCGAGAQLAAGYVETLGQLDGVGAPTAVEAFERVSHTAKSLQFVLSRLAFGRRGDLATPLAAMAADWAVAMAVVTARYG